LRNLSALERLKTLSASHSEEGPVSDIFLFLYAPLSSYISEERPFDKGDDRGNHPYGKS